MKTSTVKLTQDGDYYEATVSRATGAIGRDHSVMLEALLETSRTGGLAEKDQGLEFMRVACVPATIDSKGFPFPPTLEQFAGLPEQFLDMWYNTVRELNPHWWANEESREDAVKKVTEPTSSSPNG